MSASIGDGTRIWQASVILAGAEIGRDCNINAHCLVEGGARVGNGVTLKCGVYVWDGVTLDDDVFVGPNVTFTNDPTPRSGRHRAQYEQTHVARGASIGAASTILSGITIGEYAMIGAASLVTRSVPPHALWFGHPARPHGFVCRCGRRLGSNLRCSECGSSFEAVGDGGLRGAR
jgi:UDP-2-acetamido-3-amino-2,3-dideoxy-glucuronate N-acetyltransferase